MDIKPVTAIRLYENCDQLPMWNFEQIRKHNDFRYLVYGFEGWGDVEVPEDADSVWGDILNEYSELTKNNSTIQYFELYADVSDLETRHYFGAMLLKNIAERWEAMDAEMQKGYINTLKDFRFYLNTSKPFDKELERLMRQLKAVKMKLEQSQAELEQFKDNRPDSDIVETKVKIQRIIQMPIDLKKTSVKEWLFIVEDAVKSSKPMKNGK